MGNIFYIMGKSATGKDTIYEELLKREELQLKPLILYTTRPIRANETDGVEYHFIDEQILQGFLDRGQVIELREYHTVHGIWKYMTVDDGSFSADGEDYLTIGVPDAFKKMKEYYGSDRVVPLYIEVEDGSRLERAIKRERKQAKPAFEEVCRRFLADQQDFSEEKLAQAGIDRRFANDEDRQICMDEIAEYIRSRREW